MGTSAMPPTDGMHYELRFRSLSGDGRGYSLPCDATGRVDLDVLSQSALNNYLYARTVIGREFRTPVVEPSMH